MNFNEDPEHQWRSRTQIKSNFFGNIKSWPVSKMENSSKQLRLIKESLMMSLISHFQICYYAQIQKIKFSS